MPGDRKLRVYRELTKEGRRRRRAHIKGNRRRILARAHVLEILSFDPLLTARCSCGWSFSCDPAGRSPMQLRAAATLAYRLHLPKPEDVRVRRFWARLGPNQSYTH